MIQKEVAQRLTANPGSKAYGSLSIFVQYRCRVEIIKYIKKTAFSPQPDVDSALVKFTLLDEPPVKVKNERLFFDIIHAGFMYRRKMLINAISKYSNLGINREELEKAFKYLNLSTSIRAESLSMSELADLSNYIKL
jgi:16S rRNA (adenine1518-N6/adenine1519-N6)-dimethyltransferase